MPGYWNVPETGQREKREPASWTSGGGDQGRDDGGRDDGGRDDRQAQIAEANRQAQLRYQEQQRIDAAKQAEQRKQYAESIKKAGALTSGALSGSALWSKSPVLYEEKLKKAVGPAGQYEEETDFFDPTSKKIGQVDLSQTTVDGLTPYYSTLHPDAVNTGNAKWKAEMKALSEGKSEEEALAIGSQVNEIFNEAIADRDRGDYTKLEAIMSGKNEALNAIVPGGEKGIGWYTGSTANEHGFLGGYLGQDPHTGKMYPIKDPTPGILANQASAAGGAGGPGGGGWGGGGGQGGYGYYGDPRRGNPIDRMSNFYSPQANLQQAMVNVHQTPTVFRNRGGIVSLLRLS